MKASRLVLIFVVGLLNAQVLMAAEVDELIFSGSKFVQEKKYKEAEREFTNALKVDPANPKANLLLGLVYASTSRPDLAIQYLTRSVEAQPCYSGYYNLGLVYANQSQFEKAVKSFEKSVEINPKSYEAWHQLGKVYASNLKFDKAIEAYQKAATLNPKFPEAYQGMGSAYYWSGNLSAALKQVDKLAELNFTSHSVQLENWIKDKEAKKSKAAKKATAQAK